MTIKSSKLIEFMLSDTKFLSLLLDDKAKELYTNIKVQSDGSLVLGKSKYWWLNHLCNDMVTMSFTDLVIKMIRVIGNANKSKESAVLLKALNKEFVEKCLNSDNKHDELIEQDWTAYFYGYTGEFSSSYPKIGEAGNSMEDFEKTEAYVAITLAGGRTCLIPTERIENGEVLYQQRRK